MYEAYQSEPLANQVRRELSNIIAPKKTGVLAFFCCCSVEPRDESVLLIERLISLIAHLSNQKKKKTPLGRDHRFDSLPNVSNFSVNNNEASPLLKQDNNSIIAALLNVALAYINTNTRLVTLMHTETLKTTICDYIKIDTSHEVPRELVSKLGSYLNKPTLRGARELESILTQFITGAYVSESRRSSRSTSTAMYIPVVEGDNKDNGISHSLIGSISIMSSSLKS